MARTTCRRCGCMLDLSGYCTNTEWCTYSDRLQQGSPPNPGFSVFGFRNRAEVEAFIEDAGIGLPRG